jgi:hypothetical protein
MWAGAGLPVIAVGVLYVSDPSTTNWYLYLLGTLPLFVLIVLRVMAIEKRKDKPTRIDAGWFDGSGPMGPP